MLATFLIEIFLALYVLFRYRLGALGRLGGFILVLLAVFQASEYANCLYGSSRFWHLLGFVAITILPVAGLHLVGYLAKRFYSLIWADAVALVFILIFVFYPGAISGSLCQGNYVIFRLAPGLGIWYGLYYFGFLFWGMGEIIAGLTKYGKNIQDNASKTALIWLLLGYFSFLFPMGIVYFVSPAARQAVPSIMCGFAVFFALILALGVLRPKV